MKKGLILILVILVAFIGTAIYFYNKPHKNIGASASDYSISSEELLNDFLKDEEKANVKYLDKVIEVKGKIKEINDEVSQTTIILKTNNEAFGISCSMEKTIVQANLQEGEIVVIKGLCTGLLMDVVLIKCSIVKR